jgi:hypothetical protein
MEEAVSMNRENDSTEQNTETANPLKEKVRMAGEQTIEKLHEFSSKMGEISGKIKEMPIPNLGSAPVPGTTGKAAFESYNERLHPSDGHGPSGLHPSSGRGPSGLHPSDQRAMNKWNAGTSQMNEADGLSRIPEQEDGLTQRMRKDAEHMKDRMPEVADRLARKMDEHIEGNPMREDNAKLNADDQQRLREQQLDVYGTTDTDPANEMRIWKSALRENRED